MSKLFAISAADNYVIECLNKSEAEEFAKELNDGSFYVREITKNTAEPLEALNDKISHLGANDFFAQYCD